MKLIITGIFLLTFSLLAYSEENNSNQPLNCRTLFENYSEKTDAIALYNCGLKEFENGNFNKAFMLFETIDQLLSKKTTLSTTEKKVLNSAIANQIIMLHIYKIVLVKEDKILTRQQKEKITVFAYMA